MLLIRSLIKLNKIVKKYKDHNRKFEETFRLYSKQVNYATIKCRFECRFELDLTEKKISTSQKC